MSYAPDAGEMRDVWEAEGDRAARQGNNRCPYPPETPAALAWNDGHLFALVSEAAA